MLTCQKDAFSLDDAVTYLNCAYMSPQLKSVAQAGLESMLRKNRPHEIGIADFFEPVSRLRTLFARLIHCPDPERIALIPSASYGLANVAFNVPLKAGEEILITEEQFPSNYYIWERLAREKGAVVRTIRKETAASNWNQTILDQITDQTALVAMGHVHWADGSRFDLEAIRQKTRQHHALLVIDGTQSVGALPFDVQKIQPDALICAGYKWLMGPYSLGLAYYGAAFDRGLPIEENWINRKHSEDFKRLVHYQPDYQPGAQRYSVGEQSNFILVPMLSRALEQLLDWGVDQIQDYCQAISKEVLTALVDLGCGIAPESQRCHHLLGIRLGSEIHPEILQHQLEREGVHISFRGSALRVAPHVYNEPADFEKLLHCFQAARRRE